MNITHTFRYEQRFQSNHYYNITWTRSKRTVEEEDDTTTTSTPSADISIRRIASRTEHRETRRTLPSTCNQVRKWRSARE